MKMTKVLLIAIVPTFLLASSVLANHTPEESRTVVRFLLDRAQRYANANLLSDEDARYWQITPDSWQGFLMPDEGVGWTLDERKEALSSHCVGYATSSNRLDYACWVLGRENLRSGAQRHFTSVTNELISSGQPLRWINVGGNE